MSKKRPPSKKQKRRERRDAARHGIPVEKYRRLVQQDGKKNVGRS